MHPSSVYALELQREEQRATAVKSLTGQIMRELAQTPIRGKTWLLRSTFYEVIVSSNIVGIGHTMQEHVLVFNRVAEELKGMGFYKLRYSFIGSKKVKVRLFFKEEAAYK